MVKGTAAFKNKTLGIDSKKPIVIIDLASVGGRDSCQITWKEEGNLCPALGHSESSASGAGGDRPTAESRCWRLADHIFPAFLPT